MRVSFFVLAPDTGREPGPYGLVQHTIDLHIWGAAGRPCPQD